MRAWLLFPCALLGCARPHVGARLPDRVSVSDAPPVHGVVCLGAPGARRLCAVVLDEAAKPSPVTEKTAVSETVHGSTASTTRWFSEPRQAENRRFTLIARNESRAVTSNFETVFHKRFEIYGSPAAPEGTEQAFRAFVVEELGTWAIEGEHAGVRYFEASHFWDVAGKVAEHPDQIPPEDLAWQRAASRARRVLRAEFRDEVVEGRPRIGIVSARIEETSEGTPRWISFAYVVDGERRGEYPCTTSGPPRGILVIDGRATWVFAKPEA